MKEMIIDEIKFTKIDLNMSFSKYPNNISLKYKDKSRFTNFDSLTPEIIKFLNHFSIDSNKDLLLINKDLCKKALQKLKIKLEEIPFKSILDDLVKANYNFEFFFFENYLSKLTKVIIRCFHEMNNSEGFKLFLKELENDEKFNTCDIKPNYCSSKKKNISFTLEVKILFDKLKNIKTLKFFIPNKVNHLFNYLIVLLNTKWLFKNFAEIEIDLESLFYNQVFTDDNPDKAFINIMSNKKAFLLMILLCYFISTFENINKIIVKIYDSFQIEIDSVLKNRKIFLCGFHLLDFFSKFNKIQKLEFDFNCLDSNTFQRFLIILQRNKVLRSMKIQFFPGEDNYYTITSLSKICTTLNISLSLLNESGGKFLNKTENIFDDNEYIINKLLIFFLKNMENLFFLLKRKKLQDVELIFEPPNLLCSNENYINIMIKFFINMFFLIETHDWQCFHFKIPQLIFDSDKNPELILIFDKINIMNNTSLKNLRISSKFIKIKNIHKMIPYNLNSLNIGELDDSSFKGFCENLDFQKFRNLRYLKVDLFNYLFSNKNGIELLFNFLRIKKNHNLSQVHIKSNLNLNNDQLNLIYDIIDNDSVGHYILQFCGKNIIPDKFKTRVLNTNEIDFKCIYNFIYALNTKKFRTLKNKKIITNFSQFTKRQIGKIIELKLI